MSWKASGVVEQRMRFVLEWEAGMETVTELCQRYEISRKTGYKILGRWQQSRVAGLQDRHRAPLRHPNQMPVEIEQAVLELRQAHPRWGPRKLRHWLQTHHPGRRWPAASTIGELLAREGLAHARRGRRKAPPYTQPFASAHAANQVWCMDFKGWFRTRDGERIDPLTISDAYSRYLLRCQAVKASDTASVQAICEAAFREYGMPRAMRTDNGPPFAARGVAGLSRLALWWMKLGIVPERIAAGHPEQNGRHERMHRTLKAETATPPAANRRQQQRAFDGFRREYNQQRPHEALAMATPASCYAPSSRAYPARVPEPEYDSSLRVRRVYPHGQFFWRGHDVFLGKALAGERIGLQAMDDRYWLIYFASTPIAYLDEEKKKITETLPRAATAPEGGETMEISNCEIPTVPPHDGYD